MLIVLHNRATENSWLFWITLTCSCWQVQVNPYTNPKGLGDFWVANRFGSGTSQWSESHHLLWFFSPDPSPECSVEVQSSFSNFSAKFALALYPCRAETALLPSAHLFHSNTAWRWTLACKAWPCTPQSRAEQLVTLCAHPRGEKSSSTVFHQEWQKKYLAHFFRIHIADELINRVEKHSWAI